MDEVARARHEVGKTLRALLRPLRHGGGFQQMDVEMDRPCMVGIRGQHVLDGGNGACDMRQRRLVVPLPVIPGREIHLRFRIENRNVLIVREPLMQRRHGLGIALVEIGARGIAIGRIAKR